MMWPTISPLLQTVCIQALKSHPGKVNQVSLSLNLIAKQVGIQVAPNGAVWVMFFSQPSLILEWVRFILGTFLLTTKDGLIAINQTYQIATHSKL